MKATFFLLFILFIFLVNRCDYKKVQSYNYTQNSKPFYIPKIQMFSESNKKILEKNSKNFITKTVPKKAIQSLPSSSIYKIPFRPNSIPFVPPNKLSNQYPYSKPYIYKKNHDSLMLNSSPIIIPTKENKATNLLNDKPLIIQILLPGYEDDSEDYLSCDSICNDDNSQINVIRLPRVNRQMVLRELAGYKNNDYAYRVNAVKYVSNSVNKGKQIDFDCANLTIEECILKCINYCVSPNIDYSQCVIQICKQDCDYRCMKECVSKMEGFDECREICCQT